MTTHYVYKIVLEVLIPQKDKDEQDDLIEDVKGDLEAIPYIEEMKTDYKGEV